MDISVPLFWCFFVLIGSNRIDFLFIQGCYLSSDVISFWIALTTFKITSISVISIGWDCILGGGTHSSDDFFSHTSYSQATKAPHLLVFISEAKDFLSPNSPS